MTAIIINTDPIRTEHVSWVTEIDGGRIKLQEIIKEYYIHPQSDGMCTIWQLNYNYYDTFDLVSEVNQISDIILLHSTLNIVTKNMLCV